MNEPTVVQGQVIENASVPRWLLVHPGPSVAFCECDLAKTLAEAIARAESRNVIIVQFDMPV